jgi:hypothetical protein
MSSPALKLVRPENQDIIPLERRRRRRNTIAGRVTALRATADMPETRTRICPLQLLNMSDTGLAAVSQEPVELNTSIAVFFPPHGPEQGFDVYGRVVRCTPRDYGHELGIQFESATLSRSAS